MTAHTLTKLQIMNEREFHYGECRATIGARGGVTFDREVWRRNGQTQTWKTRPGEFRIPVKYGMRNYSEITHTNAMDFHAASFCVWLIVGEIAKAPQWLRDETVAQAQTAQGEKVVSS